jgi:signal transduction histidine kinase
MSSLKQLKEQNRVSRSALTNEGRAELWANLTPTEAAQALQRWMNIFVNVSRRIANLECMDSIMLAVVQLSQRLLKSDIAVLALWNDDSSLLQIKYLATQKDAIVVDEIVEPGPVLREMLSSSRACRFPDDQPLLKEKWIFNGAEIASGIVAPLYMNELPVGGMWVGSHRFRPYHLVDLMGVKSLSEQATIALEHGMMKAKLQSMAVLEERSRIAREMHDSVVQILGYLGLEMLALEKLIQQGNQPTALEEIGRARENIKNAQADVRESILSLRTTLGGEEGITGAMQKYLYEYGLQTGIKTSWTDSTQETPRLTPLAEVQLVRIVQEALTNTRKHAHARNVWLSLTGQPGSLSVTVRDDGCGFEFVAEGVHFGLQTMRERAESVGGEFSIHSEPGGGTTVELQFPLAEE